MKRRVLPALLLALAATPAGAQVFGLDPQNAKSPLEVVADDGIEWQREQKTFIARGHARATQGGVSVFADVLTARYKEDAQGKSQVQRLEAEGHVTIKSERETAEGEKAVYDLDKGVMVLTGKGLKLVTATDTITARDSLEYWDKRQLAVARGDAVAVRGEQRVRADTLTAHFRPQGETKPGQKPAAGQKPGGDKPAGKQTAQKPGQPGTPDKSALKRIDAFGNVVIATAQEVVRGNTGIYDLDVNVASLAGSVKITRGENQLNGEYAKVDLNTGISQITSPPGSDGRVRGLFIPERPEDAARRTGSRG